MSATCRLAASLAVSILAPASLLRKRRPWALSTRFRRVWRPGKPVEPVRLAVNSDLRFRDRCHSGEGVRLQATLETDSATLRRKLDVCGR